MVKSKHRVIGVLLAVLLAFSALLAGSGSAVAAGTQGVDLGASLESAASGMPSTLYFKPNSNWLTDSARFAAYFYVDDNNHQWVDLNPVANESNLYKCTVPSGGNWKGIVFGRFNPNTPGYDWSTPTLWNQSADVLIDASSDNNMVTLNSDADGWNKVTGTWSKYSGGDQTDPVTTPKTDPQTEPKTEPKTDPQTEPKTDPVTDPTPSDKLTVNGNQYSLGDTITYTATLNSEKLSTLGAYVNVTGNSEALSLVKTADTTTCPNLKTGSVIVNYEPNDNSCFAFISALDASNGYDFTGGKTLVTLQFKVIAVGGSVNISTATSELYNMNAEAVTNAKLTQSVSAKAGPTEPQPEGVYINGTKFAQGDVIEYTALLKTSDILSGIVGSVKYDKNYVSPASDQLSEVEMLPVISSDGNYAVDYTSVSGLVNFNAMANPSGKGYDFKSASAVLIRVKFKVTAASGTTTIKANVSEAYSMTFDSDGLPVAVSASPTDNVKLYSDSPTSPTATDPKPTDPKPTNPDDQNVYVNGVPFKQGDKISFKVTASFAKNVDTAHGIMGYDPNYLTLEKQADSVVFPILSQGDQFRSNYYTESSSLEKCEYSVFGANLNMTASDSVFSIFTFTVKAKSGSTTITHAFGDILDSQTNRLSPTSEKKEVIPASDVKDAVIVNGEEFHKGDVIEYIVYLNVKEEIGGVTARTDFDTSYLKFSAQQLAQSSMYPNIINPVSIEQDFTSEPGALKMSTMANYGGSKGYDFTGTKPVLAIYRFDVIASSGQTTISTNVRDILSFKRENADGSPVEITEYTKSDEVRIYQNSETGVTVNGQKANNGDQIIYTAELQASSLLSHIEAVVNYTKNILEVSDLTISSKQGIFDNIANGAAPNFDTAGKITLTASDNGGYDFKTSKVFVRLVFNVVADEGDASISINYSNLKNTSNGAVTPSSAKNETIKVLPGEAKNDYFMGDLDGNRAITIADAITAQKAIVNILKFSSEQNKVADVSFDGRVTIADAIMIQKYITNISGFNYPPIYR